MKIALVGTRGIPNHYGGFEQFASILSAGLAKRGHDVTVYCSDHHPFRESNYGGVKLIHKYDPEGIFGTVGQFVYDLSCIFDTRKRDYDIVYLLGYTSSSIWQRMIRKSTVVVTNMDGLEWKRSKYSHVVQRFLKYAEKLAVLHSDYLIADSLGIKQYLYKEYSVDSDYHPYGSYIIENPSNISLKFFKVDVYHYDILIARFEPENNIEMILDGFSRSSVDRKLLLIGDFKNTEYGRELYVTYKSDNRIIFQGAIYDQELLNILRYYSNIYFHGHSVGGTNPSLLEAMGSSCLIAYHQNEFNLAIIEKDGLPFSSASDIKYLCENVIKQDYLMMVDANLNKIRRIYSWDKIIKNYEILFKKITVFNQN